jgi:hypothetical protein
MTESAAMADSANSESLGKPVESAGIKEYGEKGKRKKGKKERTERNWFFEYVLYKPPKRRLGRQEYSTYIPYIRTVFIYTYVFPSLYT